MPTPTYVPIETQTLASPQSGITFGTGGTIPQTFTHLVIITTAQSNVTGSDINAFRLQFNGDTTALYSDTSITNSVPTGNVNSNRDSSSSVMYIGAIAMASAAAKAQSTITIVGYSNTIRYKNVLATGGLGTSQIITGAGTYRSASAITSISLSLPGSTLNAGSTFTLYGIKAE